MGQRLSLKLKGSNSNPKMSQPQGKKYPLTIESLMLQQIKKDYQQQSSQETSRSSFTTRTFDEDEEEILKTLREERSNEFCNALRGSRQPLHLEHVTIKFDKNNGDDCCRPDNESDIEPYNITDFPILVVQRLLDYLNPHSILALRATCKTTKAWIDDNSYVLRDFEMRIEPELCKYNHEEPPHTSSWSNFAIPYAHLDSDFIQDTIDNYSDIIWSLEVYPPKSFCNNACNYPSNHPRRLFEIIGRCHLLERLTICRLDTLTQLPDGNDCFKFLRLLSIDRIQWMNHSDFTLFEELIMQCQLLEYLKIPEYEILGSLAFSFFDQNASPEKEHLIRPVMRYLDIYRSPANGAENMKNQIKRPKLYIDVVEFEDFKICASQIFYELSRKCLECNATLMNVYFVPRDAVLRNEQNIVESFASMFGFIKIDFQAELWKNLEVMECWIEEYPDDPELTLRQFEFLKTISKIQTLRSLTIRLSVDDPNICSLALEACVGQSYPGITKLILRRHQIGPETFVSIPSGLGKSFCNLKYLYCQELDARNEDFGELWPNLPNLEDLFIFKCPHLTQEAFIGQNEEKNAPILKLRKLHVLVIFLYDGVVGGFNDEFLIKGLRHMKLKGFALRGAAGVEFTDQGMLSLLDSPFHDTIEDFEAPSSCFRPTMSSNYWSFYIALPKKELRRNRIWLSCSILLNSLSSRKHPYDFKRKCLGI